MDMIQNHFEQMALSATAIAGLPFPRPKTFTNALLQPHDITALIRDPEVHERALFTATAPEPSSRKSMASGGMQNGNTLAALKPHTAVGRILGNDLQRRIRRSERAKGDADVELLLEGAEKLCGAYPMKGVLERIQAMRLRHENLASAIANYEDQLAIQAEELQRYSQYRSELGEEDLLRQPESTTADPETPALTLEEEEAVVAQLEQKRRGLEDRVTGLERDLGGLRG